MKLNNREKRMIKKTYKQLQEVQASCSARLFDLEDIKKTIFEAKKAFGELDRIECKWLVKLIATNLYSVPVNYQWSAKTSIIEVVLNKYGTLSSIGVARDSAPIEAYGGSSSIKVKYEYE